MQDKNNYSAYDFDNLTEGEQMKINHSVYYNDDPDLSDLISKTLHEVMTMREESAAAEQAIYSKVRETAKEWEQAASVTNRIDRALEYLKTLEVSHSSNNWGKDEYGNYDCISNKVYKMFCRTDDYKSWRNDTTRYTVRWHIYTNSPRNNYNIKVAGQERTFKDKAAAEKYLQGRIKAYAHLFTEISPPIPKEYEAPFKLYGHLLPGYTTEEMQRSKAAEKAADTKTKEKKPSIRQELKSIKSAEKGKPKPTKKRSEPEL